MDTGTDALRAELAQASYEQHLEERVEQLQRELNAALDVVAEVGSLDKGDSTYDRLYEVYGRWARREDRPARMDVLQSCAREYEVNPEICPMAVGLAPVLADQPEDSGSGHIPYEQARAMSEERAKAFEDAAAMFDQIVSPRNTTYDKVSRGLRRWAEAERADPGITRRKSNA